VCLEISRSIPSTLGSNRSWQYECAVSCMASSSSVKWLVELSGSSHLKAEGVWAYRRPRARDGRARNLEVFRASDVFIVGEMNFEKGKRYDSFIQMITRVSIRKKIIFSMRIGIGEVHRVYPRPRGSIVPFEPASFRDPQRRSRSTGTMR
jgi:hypothetical protein